MVGVAKKTLRWKSRSNRAVLGEMSPVVYGGVQINLKPSPRTDLASGETIFWSVRSWKASLDVLKYLEAGVFTMFETAF